jgi:hypothetical protein
MGVPPNHVYIYMYIYICMYVYVCVLHMCVFHSVSHHIWLWLKIHGDRSFGDTYGSVEQGAMDRPFNFLHSCSDIDDIVALYHPCLGKTMPCLPSGNLT